MTRPMNPTQFSRVLHIDQTTLAAWIGKDFVTARRLNPDNPRGEMLIDPDEQERVKALVEFARTAEIAPGTVLMVAHAFRTHASEIRDFIKPAVSAA